MVAEAEVARRPRDRAGAAGPAEMRLAAPQPGLGPVASNRGGSAGPTPAAALIPANLCRKAMERQSKLLELLERLAGPVAQAELAQGLAPAEVAGARVARLRPEVQRALEASVAERLEPEPAVGSEPPLVEGCSRRRVASV